MSLDRDKITAAALSLLSPRVKFKPYGRNPKYGLDCIGVVLWVGKQCGYLAADLKLPPYAYPPQREMFDLFDQMAVRRDDPEQGCIAVFAYSEDAPQPAGIVVQADGEWRAVGIDPGGHGTVTISPLDTVHIWRFYDFSSA